MQFLLPLTYAVFFIFLIAKMKLFATDVLSKIQWAGLFLLKGLIGVAGYYIYTYYYPQSDAYLYLEGSKNVFDNFAGTTSNIPISGWNSSFDDSFFNNSRIIIAINFFIQFVSFNNPFVHILFFCFFSFIGLAALFHSFHKYFPDRKRSLIIGIFLVPSVLFWTSGIYKEAIATLCVGLLIYITDFGMKRSYSLKEFGYLFLLFVFLFFLKIYILACLIPLLLIHFIVVRTGSKYYSIKYILCVLILGVGFHLFSKISPRTNYYQLIADKQSKAISEAKGGVFLVNDKNFVRLDYNDLGILIATADSIYRISNGNAYMSWKLDNMKDTTFVSNSNDSALYKIMYIIVPAKTALSIHKMEPTFYGVINQIPFAIANVFLQPSLFSIKNVLQLFSWIENMWLLLLIALSILFFDKKVLDHKEVFLFCLLFSLLQFAMIGLTSPVVGAMVRYKVTALPFFFTICLLAIDEVKLLRKLKRTKNSDSYTE
jgi:hypothetical protein